MTINQNPKCFLDIAIDGQPVGRVIVELFADVCPKTCENFRLLCTGEMGMSKLSGRKLYYKGSCFHRIVKGFMVQGGDFEKGDGTGGESIYGLKFEDENFELRHDRPGLLSMANKGANSNGSQFFITTVPAPHIDGKNVVFGSVIHGFEVVKMMEKVETVGNFHPKVPIQISGCGELIAVIKKSEKKKKSDSSSEESSSSSSSSEEESSSESESEKKKKKKNKKHAKKKRKVSSEKNTKKEEEEKGEETGTCGVDPAEIPSVPPNKFLYRGSPRQDKQVKDQPEEIENRQEAKPKSPMRRRDRTGRKIKGRGAVRYHSRSRSHSRGTTPPHWRREQSRLTTLSQALNSMKADRISRVDEETKDENRLGTRDQNRFGADDEKRSRFDRRLNERPQKGLSEKFAPERDSSTKFERKDGLKSRLEADSDFGQKVAKRKRHDSSRSPVADTERKKERRVERVDRDRDVEKLTERTKSPEERKKIAITPLATKSHQNKESPHKRSKTVKHDEYDPFSKNDKGSDSEAELKGNKVQSALQRCKERESSHSTQKPSSQKDDFHDLEKRGNGNNVSKDELNKETVKECNIDVALKCKNVESKHKMKQSHSRDDETSKHIEQRKAGFSPTREGHGTSRNIRRSRSREAPSKPKNVRSDSRNEKLRGRMSRSRDERSASRERRLRSERNESYVQRLPSGSRGRSPNRSRFRRGEPFEGGRHQRSTSGSRVRNSRFESGNSPVRLRDHASRESLSNKMLKRDDEKCGRLAWQPPMEIEYETQGGNENVSASQVAGTAKPTDIHYFHEQVISDNPQTAPDTDLSEKSMSMSSSGDEKANGFGKEKVNAKKDEIHSSTGTYKGDRSSSSDSSSESSSSERSKSLKRGPRDSDYDDGHVKDKKKLVKRHQRKESDAAASSSDDEEAGKHKSLKPQNLENVKDTECDINSIPLPLGSSECGLETDFTHAPELKETRKLPDSQNAEQSTGKSKSEGKVMEGKCRRIEDESEEMGTNSAVGNNSRVKSSQGHMSPRRARSPGRSRSSKRDRRSRSIRRNRSFRRRSRSGMRNRSLRRSRSDRRNRSRRSRSRGWERTRRSRSMRRDRSRRSRSGRRDRSRRSRSVRRDRSRRDRGRGRSRSSSVSISRKEGQRRRGRSTRSRSASGSEKFTKRGSPSGKLSRGRRSNDAGRSSSSSSSSSS